jgi:(2Fe-2S) ferredoxin
MSTPNATETATKLGVGRLQRHLLICVGKPPNADGSQPPTCCLRGDGEASWNHLKKRLAELGLANPSGGVARSKVECLRVCCEGPIGVVYPDGTWYRSLTPANIDRVIAEHVQAGREVSELVIGRDELAGGE